MGLVKATVSATKSVMTEQWKEYFICEGIEPDIMMVRGVKVTGNNSENIKADDNVISDGSVIAVSDAQTAIVVSQGKVTDVFSEPGEHVLHNGAPSLFGGSNVGKIGKEILKRIGFGGDVPTTTQRVYYVNQKEIPGNDFSLIIPLRVKDDNLTLDMDATFKVSGMYSFKITEPEKVYKTLMGNVERVYKTSWFVKQLTMDLNKYFMKIMADYSDYGLRPFEAPAVAEKTADRIKSELSDFLKEKRGIEIVSLAFDTFRVIDADTAMITALQRDKVLTDPAMAAATLSSAQSEAMQAAASNTLSEN